MKTIVEELTKPILVGRSSSVFTRVTRIFAAEMGVTYSFRVVPDLLSEDPNQYGGNPALKMPTLQSARGVWFGALNICRELARSSSDRPTPVWPEDLSEALPANAQELVSQAMSTEVALIMRHVAEAADGNAHHKKMKQSLLNSMAWLDNNIEQVLDALPQHRALSYLEVTLFCLVSHLEFRSILPIDPYSNLRDFCRRFAARPSAEQTVYRFDT
jgi:glutathione S-transferase